MSDELQAILGDLRTSEKFGEGFQTFGEGFQIFIRRFGFGEEKNKFGEGFQTFGEAF